MGTDTSIVVRWRTAELSDSRVYYGPTPETLTMWSGDFGLKTEHEVTLDKLQPDTLYHYTIGSTTLALGGGDGDHFFVTAPASGTPTPIRVWVLGDSGTANADAAAVRDAYYAFTDPAHTSLWLMLGDNAYNDGTDAEYQEAVFDMYPEMLRTSVLWPTLGNHDGIAADSATQTGPYYDIFTLPWGGQAGGVASGTEAYYSFDFANVHFVCLESFSVDRSPGGAMLTWLAEDLAATTQDWIVAFWHHPPYSKGSHDSDSETALEEMRQNAVPILEDAGVDLVLSGHSHSYERSFLLDGHHGASGTLTEVMKKDPGGGHPDGSAYAKASIAGPHEGAVYSVAGSSGKASSADLDHPAMFLSLEVLGSVVLDFDGLALDARFLDDLGAVRDHYRIVKGTGTIPLPPLDTVAEAVSPYDVQIEWADGSTDEAGFAVEWSPDAVAWTDVGSVGAQLGFVHAGLAPGVPYHYRVRAFNGVGVSPPSATATATTLCPGVADDADGEIDEAGTVSGSYHDTRDDDQDYESIEEEESNGNPDNRYSFLEHTWTLDVLGGMAVTLYLEAHRTPSPDGDDFVFAYSTNGSSWIDMLTVTKTSDDGLYQSYTLPETTEGTVFVRVRDTDQTPGNKDLDTIFVDHLYVSSQLPIAPAVPVGLVATPSLPNVIDLVWTHDGPNEAGFAIERSPDGSRWAEIATVDRDVTAYADTGLPPKSTFHYRVRAFNGCNASAYSNVAVAATKPALVPHGGK